MGARSRRKGVVGERELAAEFEQKGYHARRSQQHCGINSDSDVEVEELGGLLIESKRVERLNIHEAVTKAASDALRKQRVPVVCHRRNGEEWLVTIRLADLEEFACIVDRAASRRSTPANLPG
jgi:Holliday junction resolvase